MNEQIVIFVFIYSINTNRGQLSFKSDARCWIDRFHYLQIWIPSSEMSKS